MRDYIHVEDLIDAHLLALEYLKAGQPSAAFNLGNGQGFTNREIIEAARRVTGCDIPVSEEGRRPGDPATLIASSEKPCRCCTGSPGTLPSKTSSAQPGAGTAAIPTATANHEHQNFCKKCASKDLDAHFFFCIYFEISAHNKPRGKPDGFP